MPRCRLLPFCSLLLPLIVCAAPAGKSTGAGMALLPQVPDNFSVSLFAREPLVRNPCALAFDARGRLFVGQGPQYRNPKPDTPGDTVELLLDTDGDGTADTAKTFARGLNCIQGLAWRGRDLWIANAPDLTVCRDVDGDDVADEYVLIYTDLGNLEHGLHGLNWAPDGKLYMSKGNSKGLNRPGRYAPRAFRELWDLPSPAGAADLPASRTFTEATYRKSYHDPADDWGRMGGVLRCDDLGANLEIVSRGLRNPWDIGYDSGFNWLGTDNDQSEGDRIVMPFFGAHFGWAHAWGSHWTGENHLPTVPVSGPVFPGSGTGVAYLDHASLPAKLRGVWLINDFLRRTTFVYRPVWDGALVQPSGGAWEPLIRGGDALFNPVDIEPGPDGSLYISGWGAHLGAVFRDGHQTNEGRIFRLTAADNPARLRGRSLQPAAVRKFAELFADLAAPIPAWRTDAADELVRRGAATVAALQARLVARDLAVAHETWALWTLGRIALPDPTLDGWFERIGAALSENARLQALRIVAHRARETRRAAPPPAFVTAALRDPSARVRFAALQALQQARSTASDRLIADTLATESDRLVYYAGWQALAALARPEALRSLADDPRAGVRRATLLALLDRGALDVTAVRARIADPDPATAGLAGLWLAQQDGNPLVIFEPAPREFADQLRVVAIAGIQPGIVRVTRDGSEPTYAEGNVREAVQLADTTTLKAALFVDGKKVGNTATATYSKRPAPLRPAEITLRPPAQPTVAADVLPLLAAADAGRGRAVFHAAGCVVCHRVGAEGGAFGPDLTGLGERGQPERAVRAILEPSAEIVEGFALHIVERRSGGSVAGRLVEESGAAVVFMQADGTTMRVPRADIARSETAAVSAMPAYANVLDASDLAALVAWLQAPSSAASPPSGPGFAFELRDDRLAITDGGQPVAHYVFRDAHVLRPHFQDLRAPGGYRLTRPQPPGPDDLADHPAMHPGVWFGFGNVNGEDFWRNKGRIEHVQFTQVPTARDGVLRFATESRLVARDGRTLGRQSLAVAVSRQGTAYLLDCTTTLKPETGELVFGEQEEMGFGLRLATALIEKNGGRLADSAGHSDAKEIWGQVSDWVVASHTLDGRVRGAAVLAATNNPVRTWWHTRDYGLVVANAFGPRVLPANTAGRLTVSAGGALTLRYGLLLFDAEKLPDLAGAFEDFNRTP
ncbi:MAG: PmoA family protein [Opitutaceae bacterium]|nr:PmoA family protein [Opitutaceae bacterium]